MGITHKYNGKLNIFGNIIKKYRLENDLSLIQLSNKLQLLGIDLPAQSIHLIENDRRAIKDYELCGFSKIFNISIDELFKDFYNNFE